MAPRDSSRVATSSTFAPQSLKFRSPDGWRYRRRGQSLYLTDWRDDQTQPIRRLRTTDPVSNTTPTPEARNKEGEEPKDAFYYEENYVDRADLFGYIFEYSAYVPSLSEVQIEIAEKWRTEWKDMSRKERLWKSFDESLRAEQLFDVESQFHEVAQFFIEETAYDDDLVAVVSAMHNSFADALKNVTEASMELRSSTPPWLRTPHYCDIERQLEEMIETLDELESRAGYYERVSKEAQRYDSPWRRFCRSHVAKQTYDRIQ